MPLYEYQCEACSHRFERIQRYSDPPVDVCPSCGGSVKKLLSSPAIQFKGSGWYITDYARKPSGEAAKTETKDTKDTKDTKKDTSGEKVSGEGGGSSTESGAKDSASAQNKPASSKPASAKSE